MAIFFRKNYSFTELKRVVTDFKRDPYKTILFLKIQGGNKGLINRLQQKL